MDTEILLSKVFPTGASYNITTSFLYIDDPNIVSTSDDKKGEFLCVRENEEIVYLNLNYYYLENKFCDKIIYHPYKIGNSTYTFRIFNKIQDKLYVPSKNKCTINLSNTCHKNCSECNYVGTDEHQLCTKCEEATALPSDRS